MDARSISQGVGKLERDLVRCLKRSGVGLEIIGAVEIEIVNMDVLAGIAAVDNANEQRKLNVVKSLIGEKDPSGSYALVHLHAMVDLGAGAGDNEQMLSGALRDQFPGNYRIELKQTFGSKSIGDNLRHISAYMTKGGNDDLRYGASFGRGSNVAEALEHQIWREGGAGDKRRSASDDVSVEDSRSLSIAEVKVLGEAVDDLMARKRDRTGYIFRYGTRQK